MRPLVLRYHAPSLSIARYVGQLLGLHRASRVSVACTGEPPLLERLASAWLGRSLSGAFRGAVTALDLRGTERGWRYKDCARVTSKTWLPVCGGKVHPLVPLTSREVNDLRVSVLYLKERGVTAFTMIRAGSTLGRYTRIGNARTERKPNSASSKTTIKVTLLSPKVCIYTNALPTQPSNRPKPQRHAETASHHITSLTQTNAHLPKPTQTLTSPGSSSST